jgi:hypothetical protein
MCQLWSWHIYLARQQGLAENCLRTQILFSGCDSFKQFLTSGAVLLHGNVRCRCYVGGKWMLVPETHKIAPLDSRISSTGMTKEKHACLVPMQTLVHDIHLRPQYFITEAYTLFSKSMSCHRNPQYLLLQVIHGVDNIHTMSSESLLSVVAFDECPGLLDTHIDRLDRTI